MALAHDWERRFEGADHRQAGQVATELVCRVPDACETAVLGRPELDLTAPAKCAQAIGRANADVVINAAAYTAVDKAESDVATAILVNADAPTAMARAATDQSIPFLHVSTDYVYDGSGDVPFAQDAPTRPLGAYGRTKLAGDLGVIAAGGAHAVLRTSWVFSAHGANFVKIMLRLGRAQAAKRSHDKESERGHLNVVSDQIGGPTPAAAIADALWKMAKTFHAGTATSGIYHFSGTPGVSWAEFAREIFRQADIDCDVRDIPTVDYPTPAKRPLNSRLDCTTLRAAFGIERPDWRPGLHDVLKELGETT